MSQAPPPVQELATCPACGGGMVRRVGHLHEDACHTCGARYLDAAAATDLRERFLQVTAEAIRELATQHAGGALQCPGCSLRMRSLPLRGHRVELCLSCGGMLLRKGQLAAMTAGAVEELAPSSPVPGSPTMTSDPDYVRLGLWIPAAVATGVGVYQLGSGTTAPMMEWVSALGVPDVAVPFLALVPFAVIMLFQSPLMALVGGLVPADFRPELARATLLIAGLMGVAHSITSVNVFGAAGAVVGAGALSGVAWAFRMVSAWRAPSVGVNPPVPFEQRVRASSVRIGRWAGAAVALVVAGAAAAAMVGGSARCPIGSSLARGVFENNPVRACRDAAGYWNGPAVVLYPDGSVRERGSLALGRRHGAWKQFHPNGKLAEEVAYSATGVRQGPGRTWFAHGGAQSGGTWVDGQRDGPWITFHENGEPESEGTWAGGKREGTWTFWDAAQQVRVIRYRKGIEERGP